MAQPTLGTPISANASGGVTTVTIPNVVIAPGESLFVSAGCGQTPGSVTTAVRNALSMGQAWASIYDGNFCACKGFYDQTPSVGTFNCVVTFGSSSEQVAGIAVPVVDGSGVTGGITAAQNPAGTAPSVGTLAPTANDIVVAAILSDSGNVGSVAVTGSGVEVAEIENIGGDISHSLQKITSGGTVTASWSTGNDTSALGAVILQGSGAGGSTNEPRKPSGPEILRPFNMFRGRR